MYSAVQLDVPRPAKVAVSCEICQTEFSVKPSRARQNNAITCSPACLGLLRSRNTSRARRMDGPREATCPICSTTFERKASQLVKYASNYCGRYCRAIGIRGPKQQLATGQRLACKMCGVKVWRTPATLQANTYCSIPCANRDRETRSTVKPNMRGPKHFRWKGGGRATPYAPGFTLALKMRVRKRDGHRCRHCGIRPARHSGLVVHHLDGKKHDHSMSNLVTLCSPCHSQHHHGSLMLNLTPLV
jgi:hypothetical protein